MWNASEVAPFLGTWSIVMTNPAGSEQTVRVWNDSGAARASLQIGKFPPRPATGILKDGDMLVLTLTVFENGKPDRVVIALTRDGDTLNMAQMLEFSETIKRGSGKKTTAAADD